MVPLVVYNGSPIKLTFSKVKDKTRPHLGSRDGHQDPGTLKLNAKLGGWVRCSGKNIHSFDYIFKEAYDPPRGKNLHLTK